MLVNEYKPEFYVRKVRKMRNFGNCYICGSPFVISRTDAQNELDLVSQVLLLLYKQANMTFNFRINVYTIELKFPDSSLRKAFTLHSLTQVLSMYMKYNFNLDLTLQVNVILRCLTMSFPESKVPDLYSICDNFVSDPCSCRKSENFCFVVNIFLELKCSYIVQCTNNPVWKVCIARPRYRARNFDALIYLLVNFANLGRISGAQFSNFPVRQIMEGGTNVASACVVVFVELP